MFGSEAPPGEFLYHYTTAEAALGSIFPTGQMRLGLIAATNDPREAKEWLFSLVSPTDSPSSEEFFEIVKGATLHAKKSAKVLCLTMDVARPIPREVFGRGWAHSRMWAQYGGGHSGVCLIFDWRLLEERISETLTDKGDLWHGPVAYAHSPNEEVDAFQLNYDTIRSEGLEATVRRHVQEYYTTLFFSKGLEWSSEAEYRWVLRNPTPAPEFVSIECVLRGVVAGADFPQSGVDALEYQCKRLGLEYGRLHWRNGFPQVLPSLAPVRLL